MINKMKEIKKSEAESLVDRLGPHISRCDFTYTPAFPKTRKDICAVKRLAEDGHSYGFDTIYLIWKNEMVFRTHNKLCHEKLVDSRISKDYIHIDEIIEDKENIIIKVYSGGSFSGQSWKKEYQRKKSDLGLE
jgi:hypothetical protein